VLTERHSLTGADTVVFYDSDFNPQMDRQCEDRAHRIGQIRDVHIYRFVSKYTVEEALLRKANQKRSLDDLVIQQGEFDWRTVFRDHDTRALDEALGAMDDADDAQAARLAAREASEVEGADDADFRQEEVGGVVTDGLVEPSDVPPVDNDGEQSLLGRADEDEDGGTIVEYMLRYVVLDGERDHFDEWLV
jgi:helicase SWR1